MIYYKFVILTAILISFLLIHSSFSITSYIQDISSVESFYEKIFYSHLVHVYAIGNLYQYNSVISFDEMNKDNDAMFTDIMESSDPRDNAIMTMQRHETPNSSFPVYSLIIYGNGSVIFEGIKNVDTVGIQSYQIPVNKARELVSEFFNIYYGSLKDEYSNSATGSNFQTVTTSITMNGNNKTVIDDHGADAPSGLRALEDKIDQIANTKQWIENSSTRVDY